MNKQLTFLASVMLMAALMAATPPGKPDKQLPRPKTPFIDRQNMNLSVKPGDDFFQYANGDWLKKTPVPASKTRWGSFDILYQKSFDAG